MKNFYITLFAENRQFFSKFASFILLNLISFTTAFSQPVISYPSPQIFIKGAAITAIGPVNSGTTVPATIYGQTSTVAGDGNKTFANNVNGLLASFNWPMGIVPDGSGNLFVADRESRRIRKITPAGEVTTFAGSGSNGSLDGLGASARFNKPSGMAIDASGNLYIADESNHNIRKITPTGLVSTIGGSGTVGADDNADGLLATFNGPSGLTVDNLGNVYIADRGNHKIRKINGTTGAVTTIAGTGTASSLDNVNPLSATFNSPSGIAINASGDLFVTDFAGHRIRKVASNGEVSTFAGETNGYADGVGTAAKFNAPWGISIDAAGNLFVGDRTNNCIRRISPSAEVSTVAGQSATGSVDGIGSAASFNFPHGVSIDANGNIYVADRNSNKIRKVIATGYVISPALPEGLVFDSATGTISGTPTEELPATDYTLTAYGANGSTGTTTLNITVTTASLPLNLISFTAKQTNNGMQLNWRTTNEVNTSHFDVEFSADGKSFSKFGTVPAHQNSDPDIDYSYRHPNPVTVNNYYRLKMVDLNGEFTYSPIIVKAGMNKGSLVIYPNPAGKTVNLTYPATIGTNAQVRLVDVIGRTVTNKIILAGNGNSIKLDLNGITPGLYKVIWTQGGVHQTETLIVK